MIINSYSFGNYFIEATGGTITYDGLYKVHTFYDNDTFTITANLQNKTLDWLLIAGGGGGGGFAGGGAGGVLSGTSLLLSNGAYPVVIGAGGAGAVSSSTQGTDGSNSTFNGNTSIGGGGGGAYSNTGTNYNGRNGGSGGGAGYRIGVGVGTPGTGTVGQGYDGGNSSTSQADAGGGGGAGAVGGNSNGATFHGGDGGVGLANVINGVSVFRAGGGGGSGGTTKGLGGNGGGGNGAQFTNVAPTAGTVGTGGGGGGAYAGTDSKAGGSGVLIIRYQYRLSILATIGKMIENAFTTRNFTAVGGVTATHNATNIVLSGGANDYAQYVKCNSYISGSQKFTITSYHTFATRSGVSDGIWTGFITAGAAVSANRASCNCFCTDDVNEGKTQLTTYNGAGAATTTTSTTGFTLAVGDVIRQELIVSINTGTYQRSIVAKSTNMGPTGIVEGASSSVTEVVSYDYPQTTELNNVFKVAFGQKRGTNTITRWDLTLADATEIETLHIVDSKGTGFGNTNLSFSYPYYTSTVSGKSFEVNGGPSSTPAMSAQNLLELKQYGATKAFLFTGCNQARNNNALNAQTVADLLTIKTSLEANGTVVYVLSSAPENGWDFTTYNAAVSAQFGAAYVNVFTSLATGTALNAAYDSGDGVHPNNAGNVVIEGLIIGSV